MNSENLTVTNSTISGNTALGDFNGSGSGIENRIYLNNSVTVTCSIIAANSDTKDITGDPFTSGGNNLIGNGDGAEGCMNGVKHDLVGSSASLINPQLGPLQNNGVLPRHRPCCLVAQRSMPGVIP